MFYSSLSRFPFGCLTLKTEPSSFHSLLLQKLFHTPMNPPARFYSIFSTYSTPFFKQGCRCTSSFQPVGIPFICMAAEQPLYFVISAVCCANRSHSQAFLPRFLNNQRIPPSMSLLSTLAKAGKVL